jgi:YspA, cpYpsA-related SLOG family
MRVIIAGGRDFDDMQALVVAIKESGFEITEVVSGGATGADTLGLYWARANGVSERIFQAKWAKHGLAAGPRRNREMAQYADALIAMPGGRGTSNMVNEAQRRGLPVYIAPPSLSSISARGEASL